MQLTIRTQHVALPAQLSTEIRRRLQRSFRRVATSIQSVDVMIADINGPRGGVDKRCRVQVTLDAIPHVIVERLGTDALATVTEAAERAERVVGRKLARRRLFAPFVPVPMEPVEQ